MDFFQVSFDPVAVSLLSAATDVPIAKSAI